MEFYLVQPSAIHAIQGYSPHGFRRQFPVELAFGHDVQHWSTLTLCNFLIIRRIASCFVLLKLPKWSRSEHFSILADIFPLPYFDPTFDRFFSEDCSRMLQRGQPNRRSQVSTSQHFWSTCINTTSSRGQLAADEGVPISREKISRWISYVELDGLNCKDKFSDDSKILMLVRCIP